MNKKLLTEDLKSIHVLESLSTKEDKDFMLKYIHTLMEHAQTPELRAYWTVIYKWVSKQLGE